MFVDLLGKTRIKVSLHVSRGKERRIEGIAAEYLDHGYDAIAVTEDWSYTPDGEIEGIKVLSGCAYTVGGLGEGEEAYCILGIGMTTDPEIPSAWKNMKKTARAKACEIVKMIQKRNGIAIVAYPSHNSNGADELLELEGFDGMEIFNSETEYGRTKDGYSGALADRLACFGISPVLIASNGISCYDDEKYICSLMVEATDMESGHILRAIRQGRFYSTEGPEIHIERLSADKVRVICSPAVRISFFSDTCGMQGYSIEGEGLLEADYVIKEGERSVRAEVTDENGLRAFSNTVRFDDIYR